MPNSKTDEAQVRFDKPHLFWWQRIIQRLTAMRWASSLMTHRLHRWDRWIHKITRGRWTATEILAGLPVLFVTSLGRKTHQPHTTPLLAIQDGEGFILVATKFGAEHHPHWYLNMKSNPQVEVFYKGACGSYHATELEGAARSAGWARAVAHYPGYQAYEERAGQRTIPILRLSPQ
jgi:deazaflavin-dependent oxidoreductase (nitroreductase family)